VSRTPNSLRSPRRTAIAMAATISLIGALLVTTAGAVGLPVGITTQAASATTPSDGPSGFTLYADATVIDPGIHQTNLHAINIPGGLGYGYAADLFNITGGGHVLLGHCQGLPCNYLVDQSPAAGAQVFQVEYRYGTVTNASSNQVTLTNPDYSFTISEQHVNNGDYGVPGPYVSTVNANQSMHSELYGWRTCGPREQNSDSVYFHHSQSGYRGEVCCYREWVYCGDKTQPSSRRDNRPH